MLEVLDFIAEKGGDLNALRKSQKARYAPEGAVDEVIALWEDHRKSNYPVTSFTICTN
jgi:seryl-tRNA synthetase